jgi:murein DD-endopeptidase MepM/ murein hydrolase activator NlpD
MLAARKGQRQFGQLRSGNGLKYHTVIVVPHARARFRKLRISNRQLAIAVSVVAALTLASIFTTWSFFTKTVDLKELAQVRNENESLRRVNRSFEDSIRTLQKQLGEFEDRTRQLAIVAGLDELGVGQQAGIGGNDSLAADGVDIYGLKRRSTHLDRDLSQVDAKLTEQLRLIASTPAIAPVKGILTSAFGTRRDPITGKPAMHRAIDIATAPGTTVIASADGIVVRTGRIGGLGKAVYVSHGYGVTTRYAHLSSIDVTPGQRVERGDLLGRVGSTGRTTGYHLHYEVRVDGRAVNPLAYIVDSTRG